MANASAKRTGTSLSSSAQASLNRFSTAQQNAETIKNMNLGMLLTGALSLVLRVLFRKGTLSPARISFWLLALSYVPSIFLSRYLERIGSPKRDTTTGTLISSGEDLGRPGVIEYAFDVIYITCAAFSLMLSNSTDLRICYLCRGMPDR